MSWQDIMNRVLPPAEVGSSRTFSPHISGRYGEMRRAEDGTLKPHHGVDFNYDVGSNGQTGINLTHPAIRSPVDGIVENAGEGAFGRIAVRDSNGFLHEILHTDKRHVAVGDPVAAGQLIGTMGSTGSQQQHVHYQLKTPTGQVIDPSAFWDQQGPVDPNPAPPAHLDDYQRYRRSLGVGSENGLANANGAVSIPAPGSMDAPANPSDVPSLPDSYRRLTRRPAGRPSAFAKGAPAVPFVPSTPALAPNGQNVFDGRFGNWTTSAAGSLPVNPDGTNAAPPNGSAAPDSDDWLARLFNLTR
jgi:hypothetical protein